MAKSRELGMQTFDQAILALYQEGRIGYDEALRNADSANELRLQIKLAEGGGPDTGGLSLQSTGEEESEDNIM